MVQAFASGLPAISGRQQPQVAADVDYPQYGIILVHPGPDTLHEENRHAAIVPILCNDLLMRTDQELTVVEQHMNVMVYDTTPNTTDFSGAIPPYFLCGATLHKDDVMRHEGTAIEFSQEVSFDEITKSTKSKLRLQKTIRLANREWTFVITDTGSTQVGSEMGFIALGAVLILVSTISLSLLIYTNARKIRKISRIRAATEAEKTQVRLESARKVAQQERDLNDFIAHEVRNPLNAALCATTFVSASVYESEPLITEESKKNVREDVQIIDRSLHFINDLLR